MQEKEAIATIQYATSINNQVIEIGDTVAHISAIIGRESFSDDGRTGIGEVVKITPRNVKVRFASGLVGYYSPTTLRIIRKHAPRKKFRFLGRV